MSTPDDLDRRRPPAGGTVRVYDDDRAVAPTGEAKLGPSRQLPPGGSKIERIAQHGKGLFDDLTSWVDLKIKLTKLEIKEEINQQVEEVKWLAAAGLFAALGGLMGLFFLAYTFAAILQWIGLSEPLSVMLGFFLTMTLLFVAALVFKNKADNAEADPAKVEMREEKLIEPPPTRPSVVRVDATHAEKPKIEASSSTP